MSVQSWETRVPFFGLLEAQTRRPQSHIGGSVGAGVHAPEMTENELPSIPVEGIQHLAPGDALSTSSSDWTGAHPPAVGQRVVVHERSSRALARVTSIEGPVIHLRLEGRVGSDDPAAGAAGDALAEALLGAFEEAVSHAEGHSASTVPTPDTPRGPSEDRASRTSVGPASPGPWFIDGGTIKDAFGHVVCTWEIPGRDPQPWHRADAEFIVRASTETERQRIGDLLHAWADFVDATTPVRQAATLLDFSNLMYHYSVDLTGDASWPTRPGRLASVDIHLDLRDEDPDGHLRVVLDLEEFTALGVAVGANVEVGTADRHEPRRVRSAELRPGQPGALDRVELVLDRPPSVLEVDNDF